MTISTIRSYFETALNTWASAQTPALPIAFENDPFIKPSTSYLECWVLPADTLTRTVGANKLREVGIFQVNIWTPDGVGSHSAMSIAESISALFPVVPKSGTVSIEKPPSIQRAILDISGWYIVPLVIHYRLESY